VVQRHVIVMERMKGIPISQTERLREAGVDIPKLARDGVTIFFTQVFRDGFFHADMHPGNIQVSVDPATFGRYIALDFGIVGTLTQVDKEYLAQNFLAFFRRDYQRVAELHVESGWVPPNTRVDALEAAIRAVCEPHFDRPLKEISLGQVLMRLFQTSRRFNVEIQPQLVLLQKTLLNVEGLGRELDPDLDLWSTAKPFLERWMNEQLGWRALVRQLKAEAPRYAQLLPELPRLVHQRLQERPGREPDPVLLALLREQRRTNRLLSAGLWSALGFLLGVMVARLVVQLPRRLLSELRNPSRPVACGGPRPADRGADAAPAGRRGQRRRRCGQWRTGDVRCWHWAGPRPGGLRWRPGRWGSTYQAVTYAGTMSGGLSGTLNFTAEDKYGNLSGATVDGQPYCLIGTQDGDTVELTLSGPAGSGRLSAQVDGEAVRGPWTLVLDGQTRRGMATATEAAAVSDDGVGADCAAVQD
jgi:hypothetical protein